MPHAIRIHQTGGPEQLRWEAVPSAAPGPGQVRLRHTAVGLNYIDVYHRTGLYPVPLPAILGTEAAGVVLEVGPGVSDFKPGDRVAHATLGPGSYCEERIAQADRLVPLPTAIDDRTAAAIMLKGMTAEYLLRRTYPVKPGDAILVHAAAGGVGLILCQWARHLGATVIGTVGSRAKAELAQANGCHHVVVTSEEDFHPRVRELTGGKGVRVVYDSVGKDTFQRSLDCLAPRGLLALFGQSSGPVPPFDAGVLAQKGSLYLTRPTLFTYAASREDLLESSRALFEVVAGGIAKIHVGATYPLAEAAQAHRDLEARRTTGSVLLLP